MHVHVSWSETNSNIFSPRKIRKGGKRKNAKKYYRYCPVVAYTSSMLRLLFAGLRFGLDSMKYMPTWPVLTMNLTKTYDISIFHSQNSNSTR